MSKFEDEIFGNLKPQKGSFEKFGFKKEKGILSYKTQILDGQFSLIIKILEDGKIDTTVLDNDFNEPYSLFKVKNGVGGFSGTVRKEVEKILIDIKNKCYDNSVFHSKQSKDVIKFAKTKYGDELEFLWPNFPRCAVLRRPENGKWYGVILAVNMKKLGVDEDKDVELLVIRGRPEEVDNERIFVGYHMNKKNWISMVLDDRSEEEELFRKLNTSHFLAGFDK